MKRKTILSIAFLLTVGLASLIGFDSIAEAQQPDKFSWDTGVVSLGAGQVLRIIVNTREGNDTLNVRYRGIKYETEVCDFSICKTSPSSQINSEPILMLPGESSWATFPSGIVRGIVTTNKRDVRINVLIIDSVTGKTVSQYNPKEYSVDR